MHLLVILLDAECCAVPILVLKNMGILLTFQPRVLEIELHGSVCSTFVEPVKLLANVKSSDVTVCTYGAPHCVQIWLPFAMWKLLEIIVHLHVLHGVIRWDLWLRLATWPRICAMSSLHHLCSNRLQDLLLNLMLLHHLLLLAR